ncbi:hypothetical protein RI367_006054 [Sorochytrium milnesiophthora]
MAKRFASNASQSSKGGGSGGMLLAALGAAAAGAAAYYYMGNNGQSATEVANKAASSIKDAVTMASPLDPQAFKPFALKEVLPISPNTAIYRFAFPHMNQRADMPTASFVLTSFTPEGSDKPVVRPYTPTSDEAQLGHLDLVVKQYPTGAMSKHIASLKPGDTLDLKGPIVKYKYEPNMHKEIAMVAGGTGITPMLQVIHKIMKNPEDKTKVTLLFGNVSEDDILLKDEIDALSAKHFDRFRVVYTVDKAKVPSKWNGNVGFVTKDLLKKNLPGAKAENVKVFVCGPPPMVNSIAGSKAPDFSQGELKGLLKDLGYTSEQVFKF